MKSSKTRQIERMTGDMSGVLVFSPQCCACKRRRMKPNNDGVMCEVYGEVPEMYAYNELDCPDIEKRE